MILQDTNSGDFFGVALSTFSYPSKKCTHVCTIKCYSYALIICTKLEEGNLKLCDIKHETVGKSMTDI